MHFAKSVVGALFRALRAVNQPPPKYTSNINSIKVRGTVVKWLEQLGYSAESRRIAWVRGSASPCGDWKTLSVNPAVNEYLFRIREGYGSERRGMGSAFHQLCPRYSGTLTPTAPMANRLWETFTFTKVMGILSKKATWLFLTPFSVGVNS